jgi:Na+/melibiose symporter-like transporter
MKRQSLESLANPAGAPTSGAGQSRIAIKLFYGLGAVAFGVISNGLSYFLLLFYNQVLGLPATWVGSAIMTALIVDAFSDPIVGYASDNLHSRWGRRHPLMYASALPVGVTYLLLWNPPSALKGGALFIYLLTLAIIVRITISFYEIPSSSLVAELTDQYDERTSLLSYRFFFGWWGGLAMAVTAYFIFLRPSTRYPVGQLNLIGWHQYGTAAAIIIFVVILVSSIGLHPQIPHLQQPPPKRPFNVHRVAREFGETISNRSFLVLFISAIFGAAAAGVSSSLSIYFGTYFWELTPSQLGIITLGPFISSTVAMLAAPAISARTGKKQAAMWILGVATVCGPLPIVGRLVGLMPANGSPALLPILFVFTVLEVTLIITGSILLASMVADVVEDSQLQTGRRSEGVFFAALSFINKSVHGIGVLAATILLAAISFPEHAKPGQVNPHVIFNLGLVYVSLLLVLYLISLAFISGYRISRETHEQNLRKLSAS